MTRARPSGVVDDHFDNAWYPGQPSPDVYPTNGPVWSGLYDAGGRKLYRPAEPVGFHIPKSLTTA